MHVCRVLSYCLGGSDSNNRQRTVIIIVIVCLVGIVILAVAILVWAFVKKRYKLALATCGKLGRHNNNNKYALIICFCLEIKRKDGQKRENKDTVISAYSPMGGESPSSVL